MNPLISQLLRSGLPQYLVARLMGKMNPRISRFIQASLATGYGVDKVVDYLKDQTEPIGKRASRQNIESQMAQGTATSSDLNVLRSLQQQRGGNGIKAVAPIAAGLAAAFMPGGRGLRGGGPTPGGAQLPIGGGGPSPTPSPTPGLAQLPAASGSASPMNQSPGKVPNQIGRVNSPVTAPINLEAMRKQFESRKDRRAATIEEIEQDFRGPLRYIEQSLAAGKSPKQIEQLMKVIAKKDKGMQRAIREIPTLAKMPLRKFMEQLASPKAMEEAYPQMEAQQQPSQMYSEGAVSEVPTQESVGLLNPEQLEAYKRLMGFFSE